jgi:hypothetical protein
MRIQLARRAQRTGRAVASGNAKAQLIQLGFCENVADQVAATRPELAKHLLQLATSGTAPEPASYQIGTFGSGAPVMSEEDFFFENAGPDPVTLYRGIDVPPSRFSPSFRNVKDDVIYTEPELGGFALTRAKTILELQVPSCLVYRRKGFPALLLSDVPDLSPFIVRMGSLRSRAADPARINWDR